MAFHFSRICRKFAKIQKHGLRESFAQIVLLLTFLRKFLGNNSYFLKNINSYTYFREDFRHFCTFSKNAKPCYSCREGTLSILHRMQCEPRIYPTVLHPSSISFACTPVCASTRHPSLRVQVRDSPHETVLGRGHSPDGHPRPRGGRQPLLHWPFGRRKFIL
jgi:hypothetical protein